MCADFTKLPQEIHDLEAAGADSFHLDMIDGNFVANLALGLQDVQAIRALTTKPLAAHMMINNTHRYIQLFAQQLGVDTLYIHPEADPQIVKSFMEIKAYHKHCGVVISPNTSIAMVEELFNLVDFVLVMTVNLGFAGQTYLDFVTTKIKKLIPYKQKYNFQIVVDGAISPAKIAELGAIGVDGFVLGTSALFNKKEAYQNILPQLKKLN